jgi:hypothetical protein
VEGPTTTSEEADEPILSSKAIELCWLSRFDDAAPVLAKDHKLPTAKFMGDELLDEAAAANQAQKAVKADDSAVPTGSFGNDTCSTRPQIGEVTRMKNGKINGSNFDRRAAF